MYTRINNNNTYEKTFLFDPFVFETLKSIIGSKLYVETVTSGLEGTLADVKQDHIILEDANKVPHFIRIQQIVFVKPM
jgi:hypothetical protein